MGDNQRKPISQEGFQTEEFFIPSLFKENQFLKTDLNKIKKTYSSWFFLIISLSIGIYPLIMSLVIGFAGVILWSENPDQMTWVGLTISIILLILAILYMMSTISILASEDYVLPVLSILFSGILWASYLVLGVILTSFAVGL